MKNNQHTAVKYRPDIDGLRALAVLFVIFYHAGFNALTGGFIGVDIFFVISGYLITKIITNDIENNQFSILNFYERRVRRILPALYTVIITCTITSYFLLLPQEFDDFGQSIVAASTFLSNMLFWREAGYFDSAADLKPLLHTWSLAVEEQFYIFFPIFLLCLYKFCKNLQSPILLACTALSLSLSIWATTNAITANFYFAPTRAWELLIGSLLALRFIPRISHKWLLELCAVLGFSMIVYASFSYNHATPFPGLSALLPCLGAAAIIYTGTHRSTYISQFLSLKPFILIGLCSYSLYLWHWPIFVFARYISTSGLTMHSISISLILTFLISYISWRFIETPFRKKQINPTKKSIFASTIISSFLLILIGSIITLNSGFPQRFDQIEKLETLKRRNFNQKCADIPASQFNEQKCQFGISKNGQNNYVIWGDSHAQAMTPAIVESAKRYGQFSGFLSANSGCPPLIGVQLLHQKDNKTCRQINAKTLENIKSGVTVFLVARWTYYTDRSSINKEGPVWVKDNISTERSEDENYRVIERSLKKTISYLKDKNVRVVLVDSVPEFSKDVPNTYWQFGKEVTISKEKYDHRMDRINNILSDIENQFEITRIQPANVFCSNHVCHSIKKGNVYFRDNDHISPAGADKISPLYDKIFKQ